MIAVPLTYPDNVDFKYYKIPQPGISETDHTFALVFENEKAFYRYLNRLCDVTDEYTYLFIDKHQKNDFHKLMFCKKLLIILSNAKF